MNTNLRALLFAVTVTAALTVTFDNVVAAETQPVYRLDGVSVTAHREDFDADGDVKAIRLEAVVVTGHRAIAE